MYNRKFSDIEISILASLYILERVQFNISMLIKLCDLSHASMITMYQLQKKTTKANKSKTKKVINHFKVFVPVFSPK